MNKSKQNISRLKPPHIIMLSGKIKTGKDDAAKHIKKLVEKKGLKAKIIKFADPIKMVVAKMLNVPVSKMEDRKFKNSPISWLTNQTPRSLAIDVGQGLRWSVHNTIWSKLTMQVIEKALPKYDVFIISDWRFDIEKIIVDSWTYQSPYTELDSTKYVHDIRLYNCQLRDDIVKTEMIMDTFEGMIENSPVKIKRHTSGEPYCKLGISYWLKAIEKVERVRTDISECDLDDGDELGDINYSLFVKNVQGRQDETLESITNYINQIQW